METEFEQLRIEIENCKKCPLYKTRNKIVFGNGNSNAEIFVIAEAPGYEEDKTGIAFVGRSGQLLDKIFAACNFSREKHLFIGNILKCRPPQNRTPSIEEMAECLPYLRRQVEMIKPKIIITLGATSLKALIDKNAKITKERGQWKLWNNILLMPTYHPSALLRNPALKHETWNDFKKVILKYRELVDNKHICKHI
ncbi:MAG: uracil-DNA glycosylase [Saprospiraceae bacterium]|nr:uracil-DNA glycosylase [Saprospiraceae bacterium]